MTGISRSDGLPVVRMIYLNGEVMVAAPGETPPKPNADWFMTTHYPRFVQVVQAAGFTPSVYFIVVEPQASVMDAGYVDAIYPALNGHRSAFWLYRTLHFMKDNALPIPARIDFSCYVPSEAVPTGGVSYPQLLTRVLDDAGRGRGGCQQWLPVCDRGLFATAVAVGGGRLGQVHGSREQCGLGAKVDGFKNRAGGSRRRTEAPASGCFLPPILEGRRLTPE